MGKLINNIELYLNQVIKECTAAIEGTEGVGFLRTNIEGRIDLAESLLDIIKDYNPLKAEELIIEDTIIAARKVQDFLWGGKDIAEGFGFEEFIRMLKKRIIKMEQISFDNPYWKIEARKRLLQTAAICINAMNRIDNPGFRGSNLEAYKKPLKE